MEEKKKEEIKSLVVRENKFVAGEIIDLLKIFCKYKQTRMIDDLNCVLNCEDSEIAMGVGAMSIIIKNVPDIPEFIESRVQSGENIYAGEKRVHYNFAFNQIHLYTDSFSDDKDYKEASLELIESELEPIAVTQIICSNFINVLEKSSKIVPLEQSRTVIIKGELTREDTGRFKFDIVDGKPSFTLNAHPTLPFNIKQYHTHNPIKIKENYNYECILKDYDSEVDLEVLRPFGEVIFGTFGEKNKPFTPDLVKVMNSGMAFTDTDRVYISDSVKFNPSNKTEEITPIHLASDFLMELLVTAVGLNFLGLDIILNKNQRGIIRLMGKSTEGLELDAIIGTLDQNSGMQTR